MTSIKEVAKLAGVSPSTVSRVINKTANVDIEKKRRVLKAIEETGFKPNQVARSLFKKSSNIIGVILPNISNPFFTEMTKYIEDEAYANDYKIIICYSYNNIKKQKENLDMLVSMNADGIILLTNDESIKDYLDNYKIPIVVLDRHFNSSRNLTHISANHYEGAILATEHLLDCGCRNIVHMKGPMEFSSARGRNNGYVDCCKKYGLEVKTVECNYSYEAGIISTDKLLEKYPKVDGIVASNDIVAIATYKVLLKNGYSVPKDIMLIGFDNIEMSRMFTPELTTIKQPIEEMGRIAVKSIVDFKNEKKVEKDHIFDVKLIERDTTIRRKNENFSNR